MEQGKKRYKDNYFEPVEVRAKTESVTITERVQTDQTVRTVYSMSKTDTEEMCEDHDHDECINSTAVDRAQSTTSQDTVEKLEKAKPKDPIHKVSVKNALRRKISDLLRRVERNKERETDLARQIRECETKTSDEELVVMQLHARLQSLETKLYAKDIANDHLKKRLFDQKVEANHNQESWSRQLDFSDTHAEECEAVRSTCGDLWIEAERMKTRADQLDEECRNIDQKFQAEEDAYDEVKRRVKHLENELQNVNAEAARKQSQEEENQQTEETMRTKFEENAVKYKDADRLATMLEMEAAKLQRIYDNKCEWLVTLLKQHEQIKKRLVRAYKTQDEEAIVNNNSRRRLTTTPAFFPLPRLSEA